jgi:hypothetical protein
MSEERTIRTGPRKGFVVLYRSAAQDTRLSLEARGLLVMMASLPDNWSYSETGLASKAGCGRQKVNRILRELIDAGYLLREQRHGEHGKFASCTYVLQEEAPAGKAKKEPLYEKPSTAQPSTVKPSTGNQALNNKEEKNKEINTPITQTARHREEIPGGIPCAARTRPAASACESPGRAWPHGSACSARSNSRGSRHTPGSPQQARRDAHSRPRPSGHTAGFPGIDIRPAAGPQPLGVSSAESCTRPTWCPPCVGSAFWHRAITSRQNKRAQADMNALALHTAQAHWLRLKSIFRYCSRLQCRQKTKALTLPSGGSRSNFIARQEGHITHPSFMLSLPCSFWFFNTYHRLF